jgi:hypothetical protein
MIAIERSVVLDFLSPCSGRYLRYKFSRHYEAQLAVSICRNEDFREARQGRVDVAGMGGTMK